MQTTLQKVLEMTPKTYNLTKDGKCTGCGECCGNILPVTDKEVRIIKRYVKKHNIKASRHLMPLSNPILDLTCPFLDTTKSCDKCKIYEVRPAICRSFLCSHPRASMYDKELLKGVRKPTDMRATFFGR